MASEKEGYCKYMLEVHRSRKKLLNTPENWKRYAVYMDKCRTEK